MKNYLLIFLFGFVVFNLKAQNPNWSVNPSGYQHSMTFTSFLNVDGTTLSSADDKVAAFVNGEIRGVANVTYVASVAKYVAYLSVYANTNGEAINFKVYNSATDVVSDISENENFEIDGNIGGIFQSYSVASPALSNEAVLSSFSILGITSVSQTINDNQVSIVLPINTVVSNLIAEFSVSTGASVFVDTTKQVSGIATQDFSNTVKYKLLSENEAVLVEYEVNVTTGNADIASPEIILKSAAKTSVKQAPILIDLETNVSILDFVAEDILLTNAIVSSTIKENELLYKLEIVPIQQGGFSIEIPSNVLFNSNNDGNSASNKLTFNYDLVAPYLLSIKRKKPAEEITVSDTLEFRVIFSETVENVFSTSFESVSNANFTVVKENDAAYLVTVDVIGSYVGAVSLNIKSANTIQDKAGNLLNNAVIHVHQN